MKQETILQQVTRQLKASEILRQTKIEQCKGMYTNGSEYCAMGVLLHEFGYNFSNASTAEKFESSMKAVIMNLHIDLCTWQQVMSMNDKGKKSFSEIADWLEERGL